MPIESYDYPGPFLEQFPKLSRSLVCNQFCYAVRDHKAQGAPLNAEALIVLVQGDAVRRLNHERDENARAVQELLLNALFTAEARNFAAFIIERESLPWNERERLKRARGAVHRNEWMSNQEPTEKQLKFLRSLGCPTVPASKFEASQLIEQYKK